MARVARIRTREVERRVARQTDFLIVFLTIRDNSKQINSYEFIRRVGRGDFTTNAKSYAKQILGKSFNPARPFLNIDVSIKAIESQLLHMIIKNKPESNRGESFEKRLYPWIWLKLTKQGRSRPTRGGILSGYFIVGADDSLYDSYCDSQSLDRKNEELFTKTIIETIGFVGTAGVEDYIKKNLMKKK